MLSELSRIAKERIIFQHWFLPADQHGRWKKWHKFRLAEVFAWQPRTYFGRVQVITVFDVSREGATNGAAHDTSLAKVPILRSLGRDSVREWLAYSRGDDIRAFLVYLAELNRFSCTLNSHGPP